MRACRYVEREGEARGHIIEVNTQTHTPSCYHLHICMGEKEKGGHLYARCVQHTVHAKDSRCLKIVLLASICGRRLVCACVRCNKKSPQVCFCC